MARAVMKVRQAIGHDASVMAIPRVGYRFVAEVEVTGPWRRRGALDPHRRRRTPLRRCRGHRGRHERVREGVHGRARHGLQRLSSAAIVCGPVAAAAHRIKW